MVESSLLYSRLESRVDTRPSRLPIDPEAFVEEVAEACAVQAEEAGAVIRKEAQRLPESVVGDPAAHALGDFVRGFGRWARDARATLESNLAEYLQEVTLMTDADQEKDEDRNKVTLMTIHSAKGLEFKHLVIAGVEEELFPSQMSTDNPKDLEEVRRLFYVALTRAENAPHSSPGLSSSAQVAPPSVLRYISMPLGSFVSPV